MSQIRGTAGYQLGGAPSFGTSSSAGADPSPLDQIREQTSKIEDFLDNFSEPIKPYVILPLRCGPAALLPELPRSLCCLSPLPPRVVNIADLEG
jgi:hypothetical protein